MPRLRKSQGGIKMKENGEIVKFLKQKDYIMVNNNLGSGSFGQTVLLQDPFIDELFVAKKYEPYDEDDRKAFYESFLQEIKIMYKLNHRNVVRIYNYYAYEEEYTGYILMEYIHGQPLPKYLDDSYFWGLDDTADDLFIQLIDGFQYIESKGIVHRDIREGNIMVDNTGVAKIIDFGLGKTFKPVDTSIDSMNAIINRSGLDMLPNEYFEGTYDSQTDMFYLAELYNRLLRSSKMSEHFSYYSILTRMMATDKKNRFSSFEEVKAAIGSKNFSALEISSEDKAIYQAFANMLYDCISKLKPDTTYVTDVDEFYKGILAVIRNNCFEDYVQNNQDLAMVIVRQGFKYYPQKRFRCSTITKFKDWFDTLVPDDKRLVLNNLISKIATLPVDTPIPDLPF